MTKLTSDRYQKTDTRKSSAPSGVNNPPRFWRSNRQTQYGTPYIKNIKSLIAKSNLEKQFNCFTLKRDQYTRQDWHSSELRQISQPPIKLVNKSISTSQNPKRSSL